MKGYLSILIVLSIAGCTYLQPSNLGAVDACKLSSVDDTTFCKSINTADSIWINPLNKIVNSRILERDSLLYVYFKYHQNVSGHEVTGCWMPFDRHSETGYIVLNFCDTSSKKSFQYTSTEAYTNFNLYQVVFSEDFKGHHDGDVYSFEYVSPCYNDSWQKYNSIGYYSPFQFFDVDFDGKQELLISDWGQCQGGNHYEVYKLDREGLKLMNDLPFNAIDNCTIINSENQTISLYQFDGISDCCKAVFSKHSDHIKKIIPIGLSNGWTTGGNILKEYYKQNKMNFKLDSLYQYFNQDSIYIYATINGRLTFVEKQSL